MTRLMMVACIGLFLASCGPSTEEVRKIARDEAQRAVKEQGSAAQAELDKLKAEMAAKEAEAAAKATWETCTKNLRNAGSAMEMYSIDFKGRYPSSPDSLDALVPKYMHEPKCPAGGTYVAVTASGPDLYTIVCSGGEHAETGGAANFPQYTSVTGLVQKP